jgi:hypothetical protein
MFEKTSKLTGKLANSVSQSAFVDSDGTIICIYPEDHQTVLGYTAWRRLCWAFDHPIEGKLIDDEAPEFRQPT